MDNDRLKVLEERLEGLNDIIKVQCQSGSYDYDVYNWGLANGLILAKAILTDIEPVYLASPEKWKRDVVAEVTKDG
jgi:hypothetical protein